MRGRACCRIGHEEWLCWVFDTEQVGSLVGTGASGSVSSLIYHNQSIGTRIWVYNMRQVEFPCAQLRPQSSQST